MKILIKNNIFNYFPNKKLQKTPIEIIKIQIYKIYNFLVKKVNLILIITFY